MILPVVSCVVSCHHSHQNLLATATNAATAALLFILAGGTRIIHTARLPVVVVIHVESYTGWEVVVEIVFPIRAVEVWAGPEDGAHLLPHLLVLQHVPEHNGH